MSFMGVFSVLNGTEELLFCMVQPETAASPRAVRTKSSGPADGIYSGQ